MATPTWTESVAAGAVLVTVNQRLARDYMHRYAQHQVQAGNTVWSTPKILPWRAWLAAQLQELAITGQSQKVLIPAVVQQQLWRDCVEADKPTRKLLDEQGAARQAMEAWSLAHSWHCLPDISDSSLPVDQAAFLRWSRDYVDRCEASQLIDEAVLPDYISSIMTKDPSLVALPDAVLIAGFLENTPQQSHWIATLEAQGCKVVPLTPDSGAQVSVAAYMDDDEELVSVACAVRTAIEQNPDQKLGVVIPNLHQRRAACHRVFDQQFFPGQNPAQIDKMGRPYDISLGTALDEQPVVKAALLVLQLKLGILRDSHIAEFVLNPYVGNAEREQRDREKLDRNLRQNRIEKISLAGLIKQTQDQSGQLTASRLRKALMKISEIDTGVAMGCAAWSVVFGQLLDSAGWPGSGISSAEYQAVQSWKRCLDDLQLLDSGKALSASRAMQALRELLRDRLFQLETPMRPIQIMGRLESHGIEFDKLWVCGMDAGQWPAPATPTPFLSISAQKQAGVPQADAGTRLQLAIREVELWVKSTPLLYFSFSRTRDGADLIPASVIHGDENSNMPALQLASGDAVVAAAINPAKLVCESASLESIDDHRGCELPEGSKVRGGARLLENQSDCPFRAFALHRLNIRPLEDAGPGLDARQHGTLLHLALELFWRKIKSSDALNALDDTQLAEEIDNVTEQALDALDLGKSLRALEQRRLHRLMHEWITLQEKRRPIAFEAVEFESSREINQNGIVLNLLVDRIDLLETGEKVVIDYKTGVNSKTADWGAERIKSPQLPLYALTDDEIKGVSFAQVARHQYKFMGLGADKYVPGMAASDDWEEVVTDWRDRINAIALEIRQGVATVTPAKNACQFCDVKPLCRIDKLQLADADESSVEEGGQR